MVETTGAALTSMEDHVASFWRYLETETVRILVDMRRDTSSMTYWDSSSFPDDVAKALVAERATLTAQLETAQRELAATVRKLNCDSAEAFWRHMEKQRLRAESRASALEAAAREAEAALEPFANRAGKLDGLWAESDTNWSPAYGHTKITIGDLCRARAAIASLSAILEGK